MKWMRVIPVLGWVYLLWGAQAVTRGRLPASRTVRSILVVDAALSVGAHAAQIPSAIRAATQLGYSERRIALMTMVFGATWYRTLT
ncbi:hypothetical protein [Rhodococcus sp. P1Y]|uniref:hypothetical protein n=1 Tax=Rhodococcus sp. P1Y TaxID=1302308 RepID=UPI001F1D6B50|nr:hypothetical protein [Rhodococcus sp. P1Y]